MKVNIKPSINKKKGAKNIKFMYLLHKNNLNKSKLQICLKLKV
jgi:hypothetical protein